MALYNPYCTVSDVTGHTKNSDLSTSVLETSINLASRYIEEYTSRLYHFYDYGANGFRVNKLDFLNGTHIYLPFPVITLSQLSVEGSSVPTSDYTYSVKPSTYKHRSYIEITTTTTYDFLNQTNEVASTNAVVFGTFGFTAIDSISVPDDSQFPAGIRRAATLIASVFTEMKRSEQIALDGSRVAIAEYSIPDEAHSILNMHKRNVVV